MSVNEGFPPQQAAESIGPHTLGPSKLGQWNQLKIEKKVDFGLYLDGHERGEILLPQKYVIESDEIGTEIKVFLCHDSQDRLLAVRAEPFIQVGEFAKLRVVSVTPIGAFLDWGLEKDLFLPFAEQSRDLRIGQEIIVFAYVDKSDRISASMRIEKNIPLHDEISLKENQKVEILVFGKTDLGYKVIIEGGYLGLLYHNEVFRPLDYGEETFAYVKKIRDDGKIDLLLSAQGHHGGVELEPQILALLEKHGGFLAITDKTAPAKISQLFGVSKKKFKIALGGLYKKRLIQIDDTGIRLV